MENIACNNSPEWMKNSVICNKVLKLLSESESVCILLDGFNEAGIEITYLKENPKIQFDSYGKNSPEHFILGLLNGGILPNAKKLITSRPDQMVNLPDDYKPKFIVKIFEISEEDIKQICHDMYGSNDYASRVLFQIESQPDLLSYCHVPINCVLTVNCIYFCLKSKMQSFILKSITGVFVLTFLCFSETKHIRRNPKKFDIKKLSDLEKISQLACNGIKNQKLYFDEEDLKNVGLNDTDISSFTVTLKKKIKKAG